MNRVVCLLSVAVGVVGQQTQCVVVTHGTGGQAGDGIHRPQPGDSVTINYAGYLTSGVKFDSSYDRGKPFSTQIGVGQVIQGWDQGVPQLSLGETATLTISAACGYGAQGAPPSIPANADLIFNVNLLGINGMSAGSAPAAVPAAQNWAASSQPSFNAGLGASFGAQPSTGLGLNLALGGQVMGDNDGDDDDGWTPSLWFPTPAPAPPVARVGLPSCTPQTCGRAISWDTNALGSPLCLCNPLCQTMAGTPGVLPCCPGLQTICLDPWRSPSAPATPQPTPQQVWAQPTNQALNLRTPISQTPVQQSVQQQQRTVVQQQISAQPAQQQQQRTVVQQQITAQPAQRLNAQPIAQPAQPIEKFAGPPQLVAPQPSQPVHPTTVVSGHANATTIAALPTVTKLSPAVCAFGATKWAEKKTCAEKRWSIRDGKCKKACDAALANAKAQFWPKSQAGKDACEKAAATCPKPPK